MRVRKFSCAIDSAQAHHLSAIAPEETFVTLRSLCLALENELSMTLVVERDTTSSGLATSLERVSVS